MIGPISADYLQRHLPEAKEKADLGEYPGVGLFFFIVRMLLTFVVYPWKSGCIRTIRLPGG
ncbi:hypothetical protein [Geomonas limicola]|uniref:hypothetical protein n=1 Tax=Geomonas limicola TaxID=2740186 RepID=UPI0016227300|nr:hypothetical protein [Geomonas limicola]